MRRYIYIFVTLALGLAAAGALAQLGGGGYGGRGGAILGPTSSTDNAIVRFNGTTGKVVQDSGVTVDDSDRLITPTNVGTAGTGTTVIEYGTAFRR